MEYLIENLTCTWVSLSITISKIQKNIIFVSPKYNDIKQTIRLKFVFRGFNVPKIYKRV